MRVEPDSRAAGGCPFSGAGASREVARRGFLAGALAMAAVPVVGGLAGTARAEALAGTEPTAAPDAPAETAAHAVGDPRGAEIAARVDRTLEARFGLMFKDLPPFAPTDGLLLWLAASMNDGKAPLTDVKDSDVAFDNPGMPAGYIYFGQFVDHDMTLDKTPLTHRLQDPMAMRNYDTPWFDLGSVYGKGIKGSPELYDPERYGYLRVWAHDDLVDLPRDDVGAAYLGDPRNDENLIVAQLHTVFIRLHNRFMDQGMTYAQARRQTRWHYQWLIVNDYLPRIVGRDVVSSLIKRDGTITFTGTFYRPEHPDNPYMPIEYSGAAYRFGHSMIRAEYEMQDGHTVPIFGADGFEDLRGNRPIPHDLWCDWNYFFDIPGLEPPDDRNMARLIDTQLSLPLFTLPSTVVAPTAKAIVALAERNLLRGKRLGLPCGQDVATAMGITPLTNAELGLKQPGWEGKAPLWYYVLKEAELLARGRKLGPVGGRIVAETILGIMALDPESYFNLKPAFQWQEKKTIGDLILLADALDPRSRIVQPEDEVEETGPLPLEPEEEINPEATSPVGSDNLLTP
ncbi:peroxidase family protein [Blastococcus sp. VKM Ac-2987]|uniref:peroxidase family protein n=1 Tax=Blastococcus sp. VKM Ac-2987 TaxID=3004141 RepID=UPI0022AB70BC|nr:heme peroxidase family protein [Blastococcus sp. VKM Ac-2987]MCZ2860579.1 heme peroxidase family protein [Blastococcus sp. VKM Ac-2987]